MDHLLRLLEYREKDVRHVLGLMSGTSMDGVDAALIAISGAGEDLRFETLRFETVPYPNETAQRLAAMDSAHVDEIAELDVMVGRAFLEAGRKVLRRGDSLDLIGSHGQTLYHNPPSRAGTKPPSTMQIGDPDVLAQGFSVPVVSDFRRRDVAAGGEGAPLVPYFDRVVFGDRAERRVLLNLGGIANVTWVASDSQDGLGFDTGPANMVIDELMRRFTAGRLQCDIGGGWAARGCASRAMVERLLQHPFFAQPLPRSTGRETFGPQFVDSLMGLAPKMAAEDVVATATLLTAVSLGRVLLGPHAPCLHARPDRVIASGGGVHNPTLMSAIARELDGIPVETSDDYGVDADAKEAIAFAVLAHELVMGHTTNVPSATGASASVPLGRLSL